MDVSGEVADLMVKEGLQAGETAVKLAASGIKNVAALLIALAQSDRKIIGKTSIKKLTKDPSPAMVLPLKAKDVEQFSKLAKEYGVLYVIARPKGKEGADVDIISNERYSAKLNALMQAMGYPLPEQQKEQDKESKEGGAKKAAPRAQQGRSSPERGNGSKAQTRTPKPATAEKAEPSTAGKTSVRGRLAALQAAAKGVEKAAPVRNKEHTR